MTFKRTVVQKQKGKNSKIGRYECGSLEKSSNWNGMVFKELSAACVIAKVREKSYHYQCKQMFDGLYCMQY